MYRSLLRDRLRILSLGVMGDGRDTDSSRIRSGGCRWGWRGRQLPFLADLGEVGTVGEGYESVCLQHTGSRTVPKVVAIALRPIALMLSANTSEDDRTW
jgi:hypothetical protein